MKDFTRDYPHIAAAAPNLTPEDVMIDGEIVALSEQGIPSFQALQHRSSEKSTVAFYAFDLLTLGKIDHRTRPLSERRAALHRLHFNPPILLSEALAGSAKDIEAAVRGLGLEGVIAKRLDSTYESGKRSRAWVKIKFSRRQEFIIGGYRPAGSTFETALVGYYEGRQFLYAAKVRAGFTPHTRMDVFQRLKGLEVPKCPFANLPTSQRKTKSTGWSEGVSADEMLEFRWVKPRVIIEVAFTEWTQGGYLRHAAYAGLREDNDPRDVHRDA